MPDIPDDTQENVIRYTNFVASQWSGGINREYTTIDELNNMPEQDDNISSAELLTIGSDPEFALIAPNGRSVSASDVFKPDNPHAHATKFGYDGHSSTAELRPAPKSTPKEAVKEIKKILEDNKKKYPQAYKYNLQAVCKNQSLGGHIHFGHKSFKGAGGHANMMRLVYNLDYLITLPTLYLETKEDSDYRRKNHSYGHISGHREQAWGFEYRTLPSFIANKQLTSSLFHLSYAIADDSIKKNFEVKNFIELESLKGAVNNHALKLLKPHLKKVFKYHRGLTLYRKDKNYEKEIERFGDMVRKEQKLFNGEIKEAWGIEFDIQDFWKVERIETLLDKVVKHLIKIHAEKIKDKEIIKQVVSGSYKDDHCIDISNNVNVAINEMTDKEVLKTTHIDPIGIYGIKGSAGNEIRIGWNSKLNYKKRKMILGMFWEIVNELPHKTKIEKIEFTKMRGNDIGFGKALRNENLMIPEVMSVIYLLLANSDLYKTKDKKKILYTTKHKVVKPILKNLKKAKPIKPIKLNLKIKGTKIELVRPFDLNKTPVEIERMLKELHPNTIIGGFSNEVSRELKQANIMAELEKLSKRKITKRHKRGCPDRIDINIPLKDMCAIHTAQVIIKLVSRYVPMPRGGWGLTDTCPNCGEKFRNSDGVNRCECHKCEPCCGDTCHQCMNCYDDCNCCSVCERREEDCDCMYCESCSETLPSGTEWCADSDRCDECCECLFCDSCDRNISDAEHCDNNHCDSCCDCEDSEDEPEPSPDDERSNT